LQPEFLGTLIDRLEHAGVTYAITGSIASNLWGVPRLTHDVDVVVLLSPDQVDRIVGVFSDLYVSAQAVRQAVLSRHMFNVIDTASGMKADLWVSAGDAFSRSLLARRQRAVLVPGREGYVASPEDVLLHKLVWHTITPSERQLADAAGIAAVQAGKLDVMYLRSWAAQQSTAELLEEVLQGKYLKKT
jgi:hypothetical protein